MLLIGIQSNYLFGLRPSIPPLILSASSVFHAGVIAYLQTRNQVVVWDHLVLDKEDANLDFVNEPIKYPFYDRLGELRSHSFSQVSLVMSSLFRAEVQTLCSASATRYAHIRAFYGLASRLTLQSSPCRRSIRPPALKDLMATEHNKDSFLHLTPSPKT